MKPKLQNIDPHIKRSSKYFSDKLNIKEEQEIEPIYEIQEIYTEQIMLPFAGNDHIKFLERNNSDFLRQHNRSSKLNPSPSELSSPVNSYQFLPDNNKKQLNRHPNLTRECLHQMNKRHRDIRTSHYKTSTKGSSAPPRTPDDHLQTDSPFLTARELRLSNQKIFTRKNILSSYAQRAVSNVMRNSQEGPGTPKRAVSTQEVRREVGRRTANNQKMRAFQLRRHNPLVIYPFESKLKLKRVDDNPKILGNIIRKKFKQMEKEDLYLYISGIVQRR